MGLNRRGPQELANAAAEEARQYLADLRVQNVALQQLIEVLLEDQRRLQEEVDRHQSTRSAVALRVSGIQQQQQHLTDRYHRVERNSSQLAQLYVACTRLHERPQRQEVLLALEEIICALLGSEQFAILELAEDRRTLSVIRSMGAIGASLTPLQLGEGPIGSAVQRGRTWRPPPGQSGADGPDFTLCIPLTMQGAAVGAIVIFGLLLQRPAVTDEDHPLLELIAREGATALYLSGLHERSQYSPSKPVTGAQ